MLSLQKPFSDGTKVQTAFATLQGNTLQEQAPPPLESLSAENVVRKNSATE